MAALVNIPEAAAPGEVVEIKILISHPMETGFRTGPDGNLVPRNIIHDFRCAHTVARRPRLASLFAPRYQRIFY